MRSAYVQPGQVVFIRCGYSEVCLHMRVNDKFALASIKQSPEGYTSVQLYRRDGTHFSSPITTGEAGFYYDSEKQSHYYYPPEIPAGEPVSGKWVGE